LTLQAVLSDAALRVMRTAAGRRALQVAVLVGGLFALGFLCGGHAHAADGVLSVASTSSVTSTTPTAATALTASTASMTVTASATAPVSAASAASAASGDVLSSDPAKAVRSVDTRVAQPVGRFLDTVATGLTETEAKLPSLPEPSEVPSLPDPSDPPGLPEPPGQPALPGIPGLPGMPGMPALPGQTVPAPVASTPPQPGSPGSPTVTNGQGTEGRSAAAMPLTYGPRFVVGAAVTGDGAHASAYRAGPAEQASAPVRHAPPGDPVGVLGGKSAVDNSTPRHGDAHAVTDDNRAPLWLVTGVAARAAADGTRDRHRDIPVFPG
jgi:hypothetical protein